MKKLIRLSIAVLAVLTVASSTLASADATPIEQFYDQGPSVKNVGGYTGVLVEDAFLLTTSQSNMVGFYFENTIYLNE